MMKWLVILILFALLLSPWRASAAIALIGSAKTASQGSGSSIVVSYPTGHAAGNVAYVYFLAGSSYTITGSKTWTTLATTPSASGYGGYLLRRVLDGTEGSSETFTISSNLIYNAELRLYSGVNNTTPEDTASSNPQTGHVVGTTISLSGFTTNQSGDELLFFACGPISSTISTPSGWSNATVNNDTTNNQAIGGFNKAQASAGAIGTVSSTVTSTDWFLTLVALQPAGAALATESVSFE